MWDDIRHSIEKIAEAIEKMFGKGLCLEAIKKMEEHIDELSDMCQENNSISLQTANDMYKFTTQLMSNFTELEAGNITTEKLQDEINKCISEMKEGRSQLNGDNIKSILSEIDSNKADIVIKKENEKESVIVIDKEKNKIYHFTVKPSDENNKDSKVKGIIQMSESEENDYSGYLKSQDCMIIPKNQRSDNLIKDVQRLIIQHSGIPELSENLINLLKN